MEKFDKLEQTTLLMSELNFHFIAHRAGYKIDDIYVALLDIELDKKSKGFWVWDFETNEEIYSPKFRESLGFENETDFPNVPESWQKQIKETGLEEAQANLEKHIKSKGKHPYAQKVTYNKKNGGEVDLVCHGKVVVWFPNGDPHVMIGRHF